MRSAAVGAAATAGALAVPAGSAAAASAGTDEQLTLTAYGVRRIDRDDRPAPGVPDTRTPTAGQRCVVAGTVRSTSGASGTFHADVVRLHDRGQQPHGGVASTLEQHLFTLADGTLVGSGTSDLNGRGTYAVIGGSGAYTGCRGSYSSDQHRADLGGDGVARFEFTLERRGVAR